jgi:GntR family transcriptional regulator of arabinose operon
LSGPEPADAYLRRLAQLPVPTVLVERRATSLGDTNEHVCTHHEAGAYDAVHHLARLGHRTIGLVLRAPGPTADPLSQGFKEAVTELDCRTVEFRATREEWSPATADRCVERLRAAGATAALCLSDRQATLLLSAARRAGLSVPDDLALVSYDDEIADIADIPLTAVAPPKHLLGRTAAEVLLHRLDHPEQPRRKILLRPSIVIRKSCGATQQPAETTADRRGST